MLNPTTWVVAGKGGFPDRRAWPRNTYSWEHHTVKHLRNYMGPSE